MFPISHKITTLASATVLTLAAALPLAAQDTGLSAGTPITPESNVGRAYTLETHGDWEVRCINAPEGQVDPCSMYQLLKDQDGTEVAEVALFHVGSEEVEAAATFTTPLETLLTAQLALFVDGENGRRYPFQFCNRVGCFVRAGLTTADVDLLKKGAEGMVGIVPLGRTDEPVRLKLSLTGFTAAYTKVTELNEAAKNGEAPSAPDEATEEAPAEAPAE
ncbi:invasion associated locus B family protein [Celeribacter sp. HF31]|nr:invasion associated locus B family protein [Celeribacter sp. HF31]